MDHAAATPVSATAVRAVTATFPYYANPGAPHTDGLAAKAILDDARRKIAAVCAVKSTEVIFTSGATEANNLTLFGVVEDVFAREHVRPHVVASSIEHSSVMQVLRSARFREMADVDFAQPNAHGCVTPDTVRALLRPETRLVSVGWANGEIGTIQPLRAIAQVVREHERAHHTSIVFHTDAGQSPWAVAPQVHGAGVDCAVFSSTKLYGPRGVAALVMVRGVRFAPQLYGGAQERGVRPGTEDPALAAGFAAAFGELESARQKEYLRLRDLRREFMSLVQAAIPGACINGDHDDQLPHLVNISIEGIDSEYIMYALDHAGISVSTKSICLLEEGDPVSPVVQMLGGESWRATTTLRFSFGRATTRRDVHRAVATLASVVSAYRAHGE
jgi:cysteine desulfurase